MPGLRVGKEEGRAVRSVVLSARVGKVCRRLAAVTLLVGSILCGARGLWAQEWSAAAPPPGEAADARRGLEARRPLTREEVEVGLPERRRVLKERRRAWEAGRAAAGVPDYTVPRPPPGLPVPPPPDAAGGEFDPAGMALPAEVP